MGVVTVVIFTIIINGRLRWRGKESAGGRLLFVVVGCLRRVAVIIVMRHDNGCCLGDCVNCIVCLLVLALLLLFKGDVVSRGLNSTNNGDVVGT